MDAPLRLYVNKALMAPELRHLQILYPFFGGMERVDEPFVAAAEAQYGFDPACFTLVDNITDAEYYLVPHDYWQLKNRFPEKLQAMTTEAHTAGKPMLIDASGDAWGEVALWHPVQKPETAVLRINQYRFLLPPYEITVPVPCEDLLESYFGGQVQLRQKSAVPTVGFVGWGRLSFKQRLRSFIKEIPIRIRGLYDARYQAMQKGVFWRERAIRIFRASPKVQTNFLIRASYGGNLRVMGGDAEKSRREFVENIADSDYTLIVRGDANAATRLYETLALGRIPVLIDTACVLPLEDVVNYREFCVIIDYRDLARAPDILADFHAKLTNEQFLAMQGKARYIFQHYLRYDAFSPHLVRILRERIANH